MIDDKIQIDKEEAKVYPPLPENIYQVELLDITSELRPTFNTRFAPEEEQEKELILKFQYTLLEGKDSDEELRGRNVWHNFVPAVLYIGKNGKNALYRIVEAFLGRDLTQEEEARGLTGEFLNKLIGQQCRIGTKHKSSKDGSKVYDNVESYYASEKDGKKLTDEEKEDAKVKIKDGKPIDAKEEIQKSDIPF